MKNRIVRNAQDTKSKRFKVRRAFRIVSFGFDMLVGDSIDLYDKSRRRTEHVKYVRTKRMLTPKLQSG
ncbi:MAG TPA: hypothetical protein VF777_09590 [Phycisphaerales bacterium]